MADDTLFLKTDAGNRARVEGKESTMRISSLLLVAATAALALAPLATRAGGEDVIPPEYVSAMKAMHEARITNAKRAMEGLGPPSSTGADLGTLHYLISFSARLSARRVVVDLAARGLTVTVIHISDGEMKTAIGLSADKDPDLSISEISRGYQQDLSNWQARVDSRSRQAPETGENKAVLREEQVAIIRAQKRLAEHGLLINGVTVRGSLSSVRELMSGRTFPILAIEPESGRSRRLVIPLEIYGDKIDEE